MTDDGSKIDQCKCKRHSLMPYSSRWDITLHILSAMISTFLSVSYVNHWHLENPNGLLSFHHKQNICLQHTKKTNTDKDDKIYIGLAQ